MSFWTQKNKWKRASINTSVCLLGCSIGDFGALIYFAIKAPHVNMYLQMGTAIVAGIFTSILLETLIMHFKENFDWLAAFKTAIGMSLISMIMMELAMNLVDFYFIRTHGLTWEMWQYWAAFGPALLAGFLTPLPYNYWRLAKFNKACCH